MQGGQRIDANTYLVERTIVEIDTYLVPLLQNTHDVAKRLIDRVERRLFIQSLFDQRVSVVERPCWLCCRDRHGNEERVDKQGKVAPGAASRRQRMKQCKRIRTKDHGGTIDRCQWFRRR